METTVKEDVHYIAFISYRHRPLDREAAIKIQRRIENYTVPKALRKDPAKKKLGKVFRDEDELPVSSSLSDSITYALDHTEYLIVICTPDLPISKWCEEEIRYFTRTHGRDHVIGVLADGTPDVSFSPYMLHTFDDEGNFIEKVEPLAANIAGKDHTIDRKMFNKEIYRIYAALIGCRFDELWQRERRAKTRRVAILLGSAAAGLALFSGFMLMQNAKIKKQNEQITEQNTQISEQNDLISQQNDELKKTFSTIEVESGRTKLEGCWIDDALRSGVNAIESAGEAYDRSAEKLLSDALGSYLITKYRSNVVYEQNAHIADLETTDDCNYSLLLDSVGRILCIENETGSIKWDYLTPDPNEYYIFTIATLGELNHYSELLPVRDNRILIYKDYAHVIALSIDDGSVLWQYDYSYRDASNGYKIPNIDCNAFRVLSDDGTLLAVIDKKNPDKYGIDVIVLNTETGEEVMSEHLDTEASDSAQFWYANGGSFTEDNEYLSVVIFDDEGYRFFVIDTHVKLLLHEYTYDKDSLTLRRSIVYGVRFDPITMELFCAIYQSRKGGIMTFVFYPDGQEIHELNYASISSDRGKFYEGEEYDASLNTMLTAKDFALVFCDEIVYSFDIHTAKLRNTFDLSGHIIDSYWYDKQSTTVVILSDSGKAVVYSFDDNGGVGRFGQVAYDQSGLLLGKLTRSGYIDDEQRIQLVSVRSGKDTCLLTTECYTDPGLVFQDVSFLGRDDAMVIDDTAFSPSGNRLFVFYKVYSSPDTVLMAAVYDASGSELITVQTTSYESYAVPFVIDDEHFAYGAKIYSVDGSFEYLEGIDDASKSRLDSDYSRCFLLTNGDLLSIEKFIGDTACSYWINGKVEGKLPFIPNNLLSIDSDSCSGSGMIMYFGDFDDDGTREFAFFDTVTKTRYDIGEPDDATLTDLEMGQASHVFAFIYDEIKVMLCDIESGTYRPLTELQDDERIVSWGFSQDDKYLFLMTEGKRLDGYSCETGELVFSVHAESAPKLGDEIGLWLKCCVREDGKIFDITIRTKTSAGSVFRGLWVRIDAEQNLILQEADDVIDFSPGNDSLLFFTDDKTAASRVYTIDELLDSARAKLENCTEE